MGCMQMSNVGRRCGTPRVFGDLYKNLWENTVIEQEWLRECGKKTSLTHCAAALCLGIN